MPCLVHDIGNKKSNEWDYDMNISKISDEEKAFSAGNVQVSK